MTALSRGARGDRFRPAAAARGAAALEHRAAGARHGAHDPSALLRPLQSRRQFSRAVRRPHRGAFNPQLASSGSSPVPVEIEAHVIRAVARRAGMAARRAPGISRPRAPRPTTPRSSARSPPRTPLRRRRVRARFAAPGRVLHLARLPARLAQDRPPGRASGAAPCGSSPPTAAGGWTLRRWRAHRSDRAAGAVPVMISPPPAPPAPA